MDITEYTKNSRYYNASDFTDQWTNWSIASFNMEIVGSVDPASKPVIELYDANSKLTDRRLVLNKTNAGALQKGFGKETDDWIGQPIRICSIWVVFQGKQVRSISVMPGVVAMRAAGGTGSPTSTRSVGSTGSSGSAARALQEDLDDAVPF